MFQPLGAIDYDSQDIDDLQVIQQWADNVRWAGSVPTRMPSTMANAGELAARMSGPGTGNPNRPAPHLYALAPASVLAADHRVGQKLQASVDTIVPPALDDPSLTDDLKKYALWAAFGVGALVLLPYVLPSRRR